MPFQMKEKIRYSELDVNGILTIPALVNYFQDCSFAQTESLGSGIERLKNKKRAWMITFWQIVLEDMPKIRQDVVVETWPYQFKSFYGMRNYRMTDDQGKRLAWANSVWVYIDMETGHPSRIDEEELSIYRLEEALPEKYAPRKIALPDHMEAREAFRIRRSALDSNGHVNNQRYVQFAYDLIPVDFPVYQIRVEFKEQAFAGDMVYPRVSVTGEHCIVSLDREDGKNFAVVAFDAKENRKNVTE